MNTMQFAFENVNNKGRVELLTEEPKVEDDLHRMLKEAAAAGAAAAVAQMQSQVPAQAGPRQATKPEDCITTKITKGVVWAVNKGGGALVSGEIYMKDKAQPKALDAVATVTAKSAIWLAAIATASANRADRVRVV